MLNALRHQRVGSVQNLCKNLIKQEKCSTPYGIRGLDQIAGMALGSVLDNGAQRLTASEGWIRIEPYHRVLICSYVLNALRHQRVGSEPERPRPDVRRLVLNALRHQRVGSVCKQLKL